MPYNSIAQRKYFNSELKKKDPKLVEEFNKESKGLDDDELPKKKKKKRFASLFDKKE